MISKFTVRNFKGFQEMSIDFKQINMFFGTNSSGKSSIFQSLLLLKQSLYSRGNISSLKTSGNYIDLGTYKDIAYNKDLKNLIAFLFEVDNNEKIDNFSETQERLTRRAYARIRNFVRPYISIESLLGDFFDDNQKNGIKDCIDALRELNVKVHEDVFSMSLTYVEKLISLQQEGLELLFRNMKPTNNEQNSTFIFDRFLNFRRSTDLLHADLKSIQKIYNNLLKMNKLVGGKTTSISFVFDKNKFRCREFSLGITDAEGKLTNLFSYKYDGGFNTLPIISSDLVSGIGDSESVKTIKSELYYKGFLPYINPNIVDQTDITSNLFEYLNEISNILFNFIESVNYSAPIRIHPLRYHNLNNSKVDIDPTGKGLFYDITNNKGLLEFILKHSKYLSLFDGINTEKSTKFDIGKFSLTNNNVKELSLLDLGFGVSQVLPVLSVLGKAKVGDIILMEQPEIHLHPNLQAKLMDIFIEVSNEKKLTLLIETHSEYLIRRLQRRLIETKNSSSEYKIKPTEINILSVKYNKNEKKSEIEVVNIGNDFTINWPQGFLPEEDDRIIFLNNLIKLNNV